MPGATITSFELFGDCVLMQGPHGDVPPFRPSSLFFGREIANKLGFENDQTLIDFRRTMLDHDIPQNVGIQAARDARTYCEQQIGILQQHVPDPKEFTLPEISDSIVYKPLGGGIHAIGVWVYLDNLPFAVDITYAVGPWSFDYRVFPYVQMCVVNKP